MYVLFIFRQGFTTTFHTFKVLLAIQDVLIISAIRDLSDPTLFDKISK